MKKIMTLVAVAMMAVGLHAQTWEEVKVGATTRKTLTYVPKNECKEITSLGNLSSWYESRPGVPAEADAMECAG